MAAEPGRRQLGYAFDTVRNDPRPWLPPPPPPGEAPALLALLACVIRLGLTIMSISPTGAGGNGSKSSGNNENDARLRVEKGGLRKAAWFSRGVGKMAGLKWADEV